MQQKLTQEQVNYNLDLFDFLDNSPTPFHACENLLKQFLTAGFQHLKEEDSWSDLKGKSGRYVITRNDSSLIALVLPELKLAETGLHLIAAHTDSPCLKVKPNAEIIANNYLQCGVEVYGGALLNPWFDRDLSLAGRVNYLDKNNQVRHCLINFESAIAIIPSLAIHLDREANKNRTINAQTDIPPIFLQLDSEEKLSFEQILIEQINKELKQEATKILSHELSFYDTQKAASIGLKNDFICSARLDNLLSCYIAAQALMDASNTQSNSKQANLVVFSDHEEVGSSSTSGAQGNFLNSIIKRFSAINQNDAIIREEDYYRALKRSFLISADNAHAVHPNYKQKHDAEHGPIINKGPVIKVNANQRYASNSNTIASFKQIAEVAKVDCQQFVMRTDMGCGSTVGPIIATLTGIQTIDIGIATFAMHSIRETAGSKDVLDLHQLFYQYFS